MDYLIIIVLACFTENCPKKLWRATEQVAGAFFSTRIYLWINVLVQWTYSVQ